jgi:phosphatidylinositol-3-phosphatase
MTNRTLLAATLVFGVSALSACSSSSGSSADAIGSTIEDAGLTDGGGGATSNDAQTAATDSGATMDDSGAIGGNPDATPGPDAAPADAEAADAAAPADSGAPPDAGQTNNHNIQNVFVILMENKNWDAIHGNSSAPFINGLLAVGAHAEDYHGDRHPSEPNYIWILAGDNLGITNDNDPPHSPGGTGNHSTTADHLPAQLNAAGISWKSYQEDISGTVCPLTSAEPPSGPMVGHGYRPKHNPFVFFDTLTGGFDPMNADCIAHNRPLTELTDDLHNNTAPRFSFISPNLCDDMHDSCSPQQDDVKQGDDFLAALVPMIMQSQAYQNGGLLIITWDEAELSFTCLTLDCPIGMLMLSPFAKTNYSNMTHYDHSSLLRTIEEVFGIQTYLRGAANAADLSDFFTAFP